MAKYISTPPQEPFLPKVNRRSASIAVRTSPGIRMSEILSAVTDQTDTSLRESISDAKKVREVTYDGLYVNLENYEMRVNGKVVATPPKELELIYHLASNPNQVFTRDQLLDEIWGFTYSGNTRTIDVHIKRLREKLNGVSDKWTLKTVCRVGYRFEVLDDTD